MKLAAANIFELWLNTFFIVNVPDYWHSGTLLSNTLRPVNTTPEEFQNAIITGHFGFSCVWAKLRQENFPIIVTLSFWFRKTPFLKCFPSTRKRKPGVFKFFRFEERFRKAPNSLRISVDGTSNRRNKLRRCVFKFLRLIEVWIVMLPEYEACVFFSWDAFNHLSV